MMFIRNAVMITVLVWQLSIISSDAADILFIGADDPPGGGDPFVLDHLDALGHEVTYQIGAETFGDEVEAFDLLMMSSTNLTSGIRGNEFDLITQPLLTWESSMVRDVSGEFYMTDDQQSGINGSFLTIVDASHPIMAGIDVQDGDELEIFTEPQNFFGLIGEIAPGANLVANGIEDELLEETIMIVELPAGAEVLFADDSDFDGGLSPGPRVFIPLSDTSFEFLNDVGIQIFNNALDFALGSVGDPCDFDGDGVLGEGDINRLSMEISSQDKDVKFDITGDGAVDFEDLVALVKGEEKLNTWIGDANLDGEFNSSDFVLVFQEQTFEVGAIARWGQGDWNGDLVFNSSDFVVAFQDGGYELGPRTAAVPEPGSIALLLVGIGTMCLRRHIG